MPAAAEQVEGGGRKQQQGCAHPLLLPRLLTRLSLTLCLEPWQAVHAEHAWLGGLGPPPHLVRTPPPPQLLQPGTPLLLPCSLSRGGVLGHASLAGHPQAPPHYWMHAVHKPCPPRHPQWRVGRRHFRLWLDVLWISWQVGQELAQGLGVQSAQPAVCVGNDEGRQTTWRDVRVCVKRPLMLMGRTRA